MAEVHGTAETLPRSVCLRLLAEASSGRLAVGSGEDGATLSLGYVMDETSMIFRIAPSSRVCASGTVVSFEVDGGNEHVVAVGRLEELSPSASATCERLHRLSARPWRGGPKDRWMRLQPIAFHGTGRSTLSSQATDPDDRGTGGDANACTRR